jgi:hypothetical protein
MRGLSDEEELRRLKQFHAEGVGVGEGTLVDYEEEARELGILPEKE